MAIKQKIFDGVLEKNMFEKRAWAADKLIIGVDEVGRGCLAGPVVAAACILPPGTQKTFLKDSKLMTPAERDEAFMWLSEHAFYAWAPVDNAFIDNLSILIATRRAMERGINQLLLAGEVEVSQIMGVVIDAVGLKLPYFGGAVCSFCHGESYSISIAAASIVAKVQRDRLLTRLADTFPAYAYQAHKGYGTAEHIEQLKIAGISFFHRKTFIDHMAL